ncbi:divalent cation transporter [Alteromonadaceae bacterium BrNp21-10]|nr:divalent cation transporter [Alteromonadaceae bacterium BrNp21-10]
MESILIVGVITLLAGLAMPLGAVLASIEDIQSDWLKNEFRHGVMAFGGGALLSAIALVLVPEGIQHLNPLWAALCFMAGGLAFMALDIVLNRIKTQASQLAAMLADFIPESIALGAAFAADSAQAYLLALLIGLQNLPEGFNAYRELNAAGSLKPSKAILIFVSMALLGPIAAIAGFLWLADMHLSISVIMLFAAGGILYSIFQDIAPQVKLEAHYAPPLGAILGFVLGLVGFMLTR